MPQIVTAATVISDVRQITQTENMTDAYPDSMLLIWVNMGNKDLYERLVAAKGSDFFEKTVSFNTIANVATYDLSNADGNGLNCADFMQLLSVEATVYGKKIWLRNFTRPEHGLLQNPEVFTDRDPIAYRIRGTLFEVLPTPQANTPIQLFYVPAPPSLSFVTDTFDSVAGWEQYIVYWVAKQIALREHDAEALAMYQQELEQMKQRIENTSIHRDAANPPRVTDITLGRSPIIRRRTVY